MDENHLYHARGRAGAVAGSGVPAGAAGLRAWVREYAQKRRTNKLNKAVQSAGFVTSSDWRDCTVWGIHADDENVSIIVQAEAGVPISSYREAALDAAAMVTDPFLMARLDKEVGDHQEYMHGSGVIFDVVHYDMDDEDQGNL